MLEIQQKHKLRGHVSTVSKDLINQYNYKYDKKEVINYNDLDKLFDTTDKKKVIKELLKLNKNESKNRFVHKKKKKKKMRKLKIYLKKIIKPIAKPIINKIRKK